MATQWQIQYQVISSWVNMAVSYRNVTGTPLSYAQIVAERDEGHATPMAGVYRFTCASYAGGGTAGFTCALVDEKDTGNPVVPSGTQTIYVDDTENIDIIPGVDIRLTDDMDAGDIFEIGIGCYWSSTLGSWIRPVTFGPVLPGHETSYRTLRAINVSGKQLSSCKIVATNHCRVENDQSESRPFYSFRQTGILNPTADGDSNGRVITFANVAGGTCDILVDGVAYDIYDVTNEATVTDGEGLEADDTTVYRFADGTILQSCEFVLSSSLSSSDTATIYTSDGGESVEVSSSLGYWYAGPTGIDVTESGKATGVVGIGGYMAFYLRANPNANEDSDLNPRAYSLRVSGTY